MTRINYVEHGGAVHEIDVEDGFSVMEGAVRNGVPGIDADCGGACACATCHVYVDAGWIDRLGSPGEDENDLLEFAEDLRPTSRLSCQLKVTPALDGLVVSIPESQR